MAVISTTFVLILTISNPAVGTDFGVVRHNAETVSMQEFTSIKTCRVAENYIMANTGTAANVVRVKCVPK